MSIKSTINFEIKKVNYPDISQQDLRLCTLFKMNLTNKEIAPILNISIRGVETARYRLRKYFNLSSDDNMTEFFDSIK